MGRFRDAITGLFTTKAAAEASPDTTVRETIQRGTRMGRFIAPAQLNHSALRRGATDAAFIAADAIHDAAGIDALRVGFTATAHGIVSGAKGQPGLRLRVQVTVVGADEEVP